MSGSRAANGTTTASAVRSVRADGAGQAGEVAVGGPAPRAAGRIAVASETVTTECGTIMIRKALE